MIKSIIIINFCWWILYFCYSRWLDHGPERDHKQDPNHEASHQACSLTWRGQNQRRHRKVARTKRNPSLTGHPRPHPRFHRLLRNHNLRSSRVSVVWWKTKRTVQKSRICSIPRVTERHPRNWSGKASEYIMLAIIFCLLYIIYIRK